RGLGRLGLAGLEVGDHLREARLPRGGLRLAALKRPELPEEVRALPRERVAFRGELFTLPREDLALPVEGRLRRFQGLLLDPGLGRLDLEEPPLPLESRFLEGLDVLPRAGEVRLPPGALLLLPREPALPRPGLPELRRHAARLPGQADRGRPHLLLPLCDLRTAGLEGGGEGGGRLLPR